MIDVLMSCANRCVVGETLKTDLISVVEKSVGVNTSTGKFVAQIMILAKISPCFSSDFFDVESELFTFAKKNLSLSGR